VLNQPPHFRTFINTLGAIEVLEGAHINGHLIDDGSGEEFVVKFKSPEHAKQYLKRHSALPCENRTLYEASRQMDHECAGLTVMAASIDRKYMSMEDEDLRTVIRLAR